MMFLQYSVSLVLLIWMMEAETACPPEWSVYKGYCYWLSNKTSLTKKKANKECKNYSSHLVSILDMEENTFIQNNVTNSKHTLLGLSFKTGNSLKWTGGSKGNFTNWAEPEKSHKPEKCSKMEKETGKWLPHKCGKSDKVKLPFICKKEGKEITHEVTFATVSLSESFDGDTDRLPETERPLPTSQGDPGFSESTQSSSRNRPSEHSATTSRQQRDHTSSRPVEKTPLPLEEPKEEAPSSVELSTTLPEMESEGVGTFSTNPGEVDIEGTAETSYTTTVKQIYKKAIHVTGETSKTDKLLPLLVFLVLVAVAMVVVVVILSVWLAKLYRDDAARKKSATTGKTAESFF